MSEETSSSLFQGDQYWSLDGNMVMEPGYPKPLASEFPGLTGNISAALAVPATRNRPETVYFFKNGEQDSRPQWNIRLQAFVDLIDGGLEFSQTMAQAS